MVMSSAEIYAMTDRINSEFLLDKNLSDCLSK